MLWAGEPCSSAFDVDGHKLVSSACDGGTAPRGSLKVGMQFFTLSPSDTPHEPIGGHRRSYKENTSAGPTVAVGPNGRDERAQKEAWGGVSGSSFMCSRKSIAPRVEREALA